MAKSKKKRQKKYRKDAGRAPNWIVDIAASKRGTKRYRKTFRSIGKFGAASEVKILMKDGKPIEDES